MRFKIVALAPQIYITDATGREVVYVRQKILKLKEDVRIFSDSSKREEIFRINADRIIDWSAAYHFTDSRTERSLGSIKRKGWRSLWRTTYAIFDPHEQQTHHLKEDNPWVKVADAIFTQIPLVGMAAGYVFHPSWTIYRGVDREDERNPVMQLCKKPSFFERSFAIEKLDPNMTPEEEQRLLLSFMMMVQLERGRG
ncbi:MAG: hypothetical protein D6737_07060 [Chloroflexi bacterium]|nr:MAG: hypothetical protein CUN54_05645 [Phototrophicales bacterium]RMF80750.1 MAG: hypothetical protein D6737_07060 [Chloroflexota bacterium]